LEYAEKETGITKEHLMDVARMIHEADGTCILWGMGVTQNIAGSHTSAAISNLLLLTGNYMRPGAGAYPLRGHNNVQGACDMGTLPGWLPGNQHISDDEARYRFENAYGVPISNKPGKDNTQMLESVENGSLKAIYLVGEDMAWIDANANHVHETLSKLDFFVVQDVFFTKTAQFADVILPASPSLEKDGTFTNTERRVQRLYQVFEPLEDSMPDWWIIQNIANYMGANWNYSHPSEIFAEMASLSPIFSSASYEVLEGWNSFFWGSNDGESTPLLFKDGFNFKDKKAVFSLVDYVPPILFGNDFDLVLNNGRLLEHFHEGNLTNKSKGILHKLPEVFVEVSLKLAENRGIKEGALVRLISPYGAIKLRATITDRVQGNELYVPMHSVSHENAVNLLTGSAGDVRTNTPAYKQTKVQMQIIKSKGKSPLPQINPRNAKRVPQMGVEVFRKWEREDYQPIATVNEYILPGSK
jgi:formate dehydrogenase major subunit